MKNNSPNNEGIDKFIPYLKAIGIETRTLLGRIDFLYNLCRDVCPEMIEGIFIEDYIKKDGSREYENINFFSKGFMISADNFISDIDIRIAPIGNRIFFCGIKANNYDYKKSTVKSRLYVAFKALPDNECTLKATAGNCAYLQKIFNKHIKSNYTSQL